ncbi:hypothetical protein [Rufibacter hautae]|uniref:Lipoprotein n=1 Tax=Rufibacter hautae TaxID=2595005 RepID=A0A5B6THD1_9BACT|nr:hypothetical protein [Rufibacter hautae]KAA3440082.1 hypothetical protein FOA19_05280 [Rufibacter hautae]
MQKALLLLMCICMGLSGCKAINAPAYLSCHDVSKDTGKNVSRTLDELWDNYPEVRVDAHTLKAFVTAGYKFLDEEDALLVVGDSIDQETEASLAKKYFKSQDTTFNGAVNYYRIVKGTSAQRLYVIKSRDCLTVSDQQTQIFSPKHCSFCLMSTMELPITKNAKWKTFFDLTPEERKKVREDFELDILAKIK